MKQKGTEWFDPKGCQVQLERVTKLEYWEEVHSTRVLTRVLRAEKMLQELNDYIKAAAEKALKEYLKANPDKKEIGGHLWYNFDHTIKIKTDVQPEYSYDENDVREIGEKFTGFVENINTDTEEGKLLKSIVNKAFKKADGKVDNKHLERVIGLEDKVGDEFNDMIKLLKKVRKKVGTRVYFGVWEKNDDGEYIKKELNFSRINNS